MKRLLLVLTLCTLPLSADMNWRIETANPDYILAMQQLSFEAVSTGSPLPPVCYPWWWWCNLDPPRGK